MNIADTIDDARRAFKIVGRGYLVRLVEDEPRYATVAEIASPTFAERLVKERLDELDMAE